MLFVYMFSEITFPTGQPTGEATPQPSVLRRCLCSLCMVEAFPHPVWHAQCCLPCSAHDFACVAPKVSRRHTLAANSLILTLTIFLPLLILCSLNLRYRDICRFIYWAWAPKLFILIGCGVLVFCCLILFLVFVFSFGL